MGIRRRCTRGCKVTGLLFLALILAALFVLGLLSRRDGADGITRENFTDAYERQLLYGGRQPSLS